MNVRKKKFLIYFLILSFLIVLTYIFTLNFKKNKASNVEPISINLITSVHSKLNWSFTPINSKILVKPGDVTNLEYIVENLDTESTTGIATFAYYPSEFGNYISKLNCFCFEAQTLKQREKNKFTLVILIDPAVTNDSKTKDIKEVTIQFTFFDYKEYKKNS